MFSLTHSQVLNDQMRMCYICCSCGGGRMPKFGLSPAPLQQGYLDRGSRSNGPENLGFYNIKKSFKNPLSSSLHKE